MSGTTQERLVRMANQIAAEFVNQQPGEAVAATAEHIRLFWDPRMLSMIRAHVAGGVSGLSPLAAAAIAMLDDDAG
jgi:formate dehydrogenase subunit delta